MPIIDPYNTVTESSVHDLWIEARKLEVSTTRSSPTSIAITLARPALHQVLDGAVVLISEKQLTPADYPQDGTQYPNPSTVFGDPAATKIGSAQVVAFYSNALGAPFPAGLTTTGDVFTGNKLEWEVDVTGLDPQKVYYVSFHGASNVLGYYPLGIQSYPLDANPVESTAKNYAASIPSLPSAPTSPTPGMVYFDQQLNSVQYWDSTRSVWIPTRTDQIMSGPFNPGVPGMAYLSGQVLKVFDGRTWATATSTNMQFKVGSMWVPLTQTRTGVQLPTDPHAGDFFFNYTSALPQFFDGMAWQIPGDTNTLFTTASGMVPAFTVPFKIEPTDLITPYPGLLFYNTSSQRLNVWNGSTWEIANTQDFGVPISSKYGIGDDGNYDQRLQLINIIKAQLGFPALCVELSEEQFNIAVDNALQYYRQWCIGAYEHRFIPYVLLDGQQLYFLNSPVDRTDAVVTVQKVHRVSLPGFAGNGSNGPQDTWTQLWAQQFYQIAGGGGDLVSTHLLASWSEDFNRLFAGDLPFNWSESRRELRINRMIHGAQRVVLEVDLERTEQELLQDRWCQQWLQGWAVAEAKMMLGMIRSKYTSGTPGPAGTISLNGDALIASAEQDFTELKQSILDYESQTADYGNLSFLIG